VEGYGHAGTGSAVWLLRVATIESIGSSTRIEGSRLSDRDVERLLSNLQIQKFDTRDEQEVAGYAKVMEALKQHFRALVQRAQLISRCARRGAWYELR
jgi:Fic family protein